MNVLSMGAPFGQDYTPIRQFRSRFGHEVRILGTGEEADYAFEPGESAEEVVQRVARGGWQPEALICWLPELIAPPRHIERCPLLTVAVVSDWNLHYPLLQLNLGRYDITVMDRQGAELIRPAGVVPQYFGPVYSQISTVHRRLDIERDIDVLFVGNLNHAIHPERARCLEQVASLAGEYRVSICGGHFGEAYARLLNRARIVFNHSVRREMNLRCFEALACGSLLFLEAGNTEAPEYLRDRHEVVYYRPDTLVPLLRHYLDHESERAAIAETGRAKAAGLAGESRLDEWLNRFASRKPGPRPYEALGEEERALADLMQCPPDAPPDAAFHEDVQRACERFPGRPDFPLIEANRILAQVQHLEGESHEKAVRWALRRYRQACAAAPDAAVAWLNLAAACAEVGNQDLEVSMLEQALKASSVCCGGLLHGRMDDPYFIRWRGALARHAERLEFLWAMAASRLAASLLAIGCACEALKPAGRSIGWAPEIAVPYRVRAEAYTQMGDLPAAVHELEVSLPFTAFDMGHRMMLVRGLSAVGRGADARALARDSARLFDACADGADIAGQFRALAG